MVEPDNLKGARNYAEKNSRAESAIIESGLYL